MPPRKPKDTSPEASLSAEIIRQLDRGAPALAAQLGPPPESSKLTPEQENSLWTWELTPDRIARASTDPAIAKVIADVRPKVQALLEQGAMQDAEAMLRWPFRQMLYSTGRPKIADQVAFSERLAKRTGHTAPPPPPASQQQPAPVPAPAPSDQAGMAAPPTGPALGAPDAGTGANATPVAGPAPAAPPQQAPVGSTMGGA